MTIFETVFWLVVGFVGIWLLGFGLECIGGGNYCPLGG